MNEVKKILFIITQSEMGGAQRFLFNLLTHISNRYDILVAIGSAGNPRTQRAEQSSYDGGNELHEKLKSINIETLTLTKLKREISPVNDIKACFEIRDLINKFKPNDLFLLSSKAGFIGSLTARYLLPTANLRILYRIGGWTFNDPWPIWKKKLWINLERRSASWKDIIIVNNQHDYDQAQNLKIKPREKLVLIHNGLDIYKMDFIPREEARLKLFSAKGGSASGGEKISGKIFQTETIIGTIANLYPAKGLSALIETAEHFKHNNTLSFFIIGDGPEYHNLKLKIENLNLQHKVYLLGNIPDAKKYLQAFDIFVLPSLKEGFPWALIEAMTARLPVIATRVGAVPEIIEDRQNGIIVEPGKPEQIAKAITEIINSDYLKKEFAIKAHQTVLFKFTEDKMVANIESLL